MSTVILNLFRFQKFLSVKCHVLTVTGVNTGLCFRAALCLHRVDPDRGNCKTTGVNGATSQQTAILILAAVRT
jgi:hypothetical protein